MSAFNAPHLPRTRSVSPLRLGTPPDAQHHAAPTSPNSAASDDTFVPPHPAAESPYFGADFGTPPFPFRPGRTRTAARDANAARRAFQPMYADRVDQSGRQRARAERIRNAGHDFIGTAAFAGALGAWLVAGTPLVLTVIVAWLSCMIAKAAIDLVVSICLE